MRMTGNVYLLVCDTVVIATITQSVTIGTQLLIHIQLLPQHFGEGRHDLTVAAVVHHVPREAEEVLLVGGGRAEGASEPGLHVAGDPRGPPMQDLREVALFHHQELVLLIALRWRR